MVNRNIVLTEETNLKIFLDGNRFKKLNLRTLQMLDEIGIFIEEKGA